MIQTSTLIYIGIKDEIFLPLHNKRPCKLNLSNNYKRTQSSNGSTDTRAKAKDVCKLIQTKIEHQSHLKLDKLNFLTKKTKKGVPWYAQCNQGKKANHPNWDLLWSQQTKEGSQEIPMAKNDKRVVKTIYINVLPSWHHQKCTVPTFQLQQNKSTGATPKHSSCHSNSYLLLISYHESFFHVLHDKCKNKQKKVQNCMIPSQI